MNEEKILEKLPFIMRAARKYKGITQQDLAKTLNCSQSALSKMENGVLVPSAPQWFLFCEITAIPVESLRLGYIDRNTTAEVVSGKQGNGHSLPPRYINDRGLKVKYLKSLINYFKKNIGEDKFSQFLKNHKVAKDFFVDYDNQISLNFVYDIIAYIKETSSINEELLRQATAYLRESDTHGRTYNILRKAKNPLDTLTYYCNQYKTYQADFSYIVKNKKENSIEIHIKPKLHLKRFSKILGDDDFSKFCSMYCLYGIESISKLCDSDQKIEIKTLSNMFKGGDETIYDITLN